MKNEIKQFDWKSLEHVYRVQDTTIPQAFEQLNDQDSEIRQEALDFLLGGGQDFGTIAETTPHIIRFLIEFIIDPSVPYKADIINQLTGIGKTLIESGHLSIRQMALYYDAYQVLKSAREPLNRLLYTGSLNEKLACLELIQYFTDDENLLADLCQYFEKEQDESLNVAVMRAFKTLFRHLEWKDIDSKKHYASIFNQIIETYPSKKVRIEAARAGVELLAPYSWYMKPDLLSPVTGNLLIDEFFEQGNFSFKEYPRLNEEEIVRDLARVDPQYLIQILNFPSIVPEQAHIVARGILASIFQYGGEWHNWKISSGLAMTFSEGAIIYYLGHNAQADIKIEPFFESRRYAVQAIVDNDKVWEIPTNLFSNFFGLPDSRAQLRKMIILPEADD